MQRIIYKTDNGGVAIIIPTAEWLETHTIEECAAKDVPAGAEFKYIEIIDSKYDFIDYATIESLFSIEDIKLGLAEEIYQMINDTELTKFITDIPLDNKIHQLFNNKILIPITDEFLRYHKESDMFDKNTTTTIENKDRSNKKDNTKIKYIITRLNKVKNYYSQKVQANNELKTEIDKIFYHPMLYRKVIIINDIEEINILRKFKCSYDKNNLL